MPKNRHLWNRALEFAAIINDNVFLEGSVAAWKEFAGIQPELSGADEIWARYCNFESNATSDGRLELTADTNWFNSVPCCFVYTHRQGQRLSWGRRWLIERSLLASSNNLLAPMRSVHGTAMDCASNFKRKPAFIALSILCVAAMSASAWSVVSVNGIVAAMSASLWSAVFVIGISNNAK